MSARSNVLPLVSVRDAPIPITLSLVKRALQGAQELYPHSEYAQQLSEKAFYYAYADAVLINVQIRARSIYKTAPTRVNGGERTKVCIEPESHEHIARVAEPFSKMLDESSREKFASEIIAGHVLIP
jgi:hypothetical protein